MMVTGKYSALWYLIEHYVDHHFTHWFLHYFQGHHDLAEGSLANQCHVDRANDTMRIQSPGVIGHFILCVILSLLCLYLEIPGFSEKG